MISIYGLFRIYVSSCKLLALLLLTEKGGKKMCVIITFLVQVTNFMWAGDSEISLPTELLNEFA